MWELYATETFLQVLLVTGAIGGAAAWLTGQAIAQTWRPFWHLVVYIALLGAAVRFVHFALFEADLLALLSYIVDTLFLLAVASLSFRVSRTSQMVTQYPCPTASHSPDSFGTRPITGRESGKHGRLPIQVLSSACSPNGNSSRARGIMRSNCTGEG